MLCMVDENYNPVIDPANFVTDTTDFNPYFPLKAGTVYKYEGLTESGAPKSTVYTITTDTKIIMGITCTVIEDANWENGKQVDDNFGWYAQDKEKNIWYFGEDVQDIKRRKVVSTDGSWVAGNDGAKPGIYIPGNPSPGNIYRQELYGCIAQDFSQDISVLEKVTVPYGTFDSCLKVIEWTPLDPNGHREYKYYAPGIGKIKTEVIGTIGYGALVDIQ